MAKKKVRGRTISRLRRWTETHTTSEQLLAKRTSALKAVEKRFGSDSPQALNAINEVAKWYLDNGRTEEALPLLRRLVEVRRRTLGKDDPGTVVCEVNLASALVELEQWEEAKALLEHVVAVRSGGGTDHLDAMLLLAFAKRKSGDLEGACGLNRQVLDVRSRTLGDDDPKTLLALNNTAVTLLSMGQLAEARVMALNLIEKRKRRLGQDHQDTLVALRLLESIDRATEAT